MGDEARERDNKRKKKESGDAQGKCQGKVSKIGRRST